MRYRAALLVAGVAFLLATGLEAQPGDGPHLSLVPWKIRQPDETLLTPLVLFWIPASPDELRRSELLTSDELTFFSSRCVAMRVVRSDDRELLETLDAGDEAEVILADSEGTVLARGDARKTAEVEEMVRMELDRRSSEADERLDDAREKADAGETDAAVEQRAQGVKWRQLNRMSRRHVRHSRRQWKRAVRMLQAA